MSRTAVGVAGLIGLALASLVCIPVVHASCQLEQIAEFRVDMVDNSPVTDGQLNGQPIRMLVETGSPVSFVTRKAARDLHLPIRSYQDRTLYGVEGSESFETAVVKEFKLGQLALKNYTANVVGTEIQDANGVTTFQLGADLLSRFTTEWDLAKGIVRLLRPKDCKVEQFAYWSSSYFQAELEPVSLGNPSLVFEVKVNGKSTKARLVSGSAISYMSSQSAREAGVETGGPDAPSAGDLTGLTANPIPSWTGRFETFEIGGETIKNARFLIAELAPTGKVQSMGWANSMPIRGPADISLGADFLRANHLIIVPDKHVAFFTYNGGPVFRTKRTD